jgi:fructuronate reductase
MKLDLESLKSKEQWETAGIKLPGFDIDKMLSSSHEEPIWIHFGAGNIFRAFIAPLQQSLIEKGLSEKGVLAAFTIEPEIIEAYWKKCGNLTLSVTMNSDGTLGKEVVASVSEALYAHPKSSDWKRLVEVFKSPSLQMVSFTITEKGYASTQAGSCMHICALLLHERYKAGGLPTAMVSMDNCSKNGELLSKAVRKSSLLIDGDGLEGFHEYLDTKVSFPWTMIDKITPSPDADVAKALQAVGFEGTDSIKTDLGTFVSPFVNAEEFQLLVVEDDFPNGRPPLEAAGVVFTTRQSVNLTEKMKVGACLNPIHTSISIFGVLLGIEAVPAIMKDPGIRKLAELLGYSENLPMAADPGIISAKAFLDKCLNERFPNPFLRDAPFRITTDTSQKLSSRFGDTIKAYSAKDPEKLNGLKAIPLTLAAWCRYLMGVDDSGKTFNPSPDPLLPDLRPIISRVSLGEPCNAHETLLPILSREDIFGLNLYTTPIAAKVEAYFEKLIDGPGAVRKVLENTINSI